MKNGEKKIKTHENGGKMLGKGAAWSL